MGNVAFKYSEICSVSVVQEFYVNDSSRKTFPAAAPDLRIIPTDACTTLLAQLGLDFKRRGDDGGFFIFGLLNGKNSTQEDLLRFTPRDEHTLQFWAIVANPDFWNFNDLPVRRSSGMLLRLRNNHSNGSGEPELHLTNIIAGVTNDEASDDYDWVQSSGSKYTYIHPSTVSPNTATIKQVSTGVAIEPVSIMNQSGKATLTFDLSPLSLGMCELHIGGNMITDFYFVGDSVPNGLLGMIELSLSSSVENDYRIVKAGGVLPTVRPAYVIRLQNRGTLWRYTVRFESNSALSSDLSGLTSDEKITFIEQLNITSNDSTIAFLMVSASDTEFVFLSTAPVALQEQYYVLNSENDTLQLSLRKSIDEDISPSGVVVKSDLPYPSTGLIAAEFDSNSNSDFIYSDIFLTL